MRVCTRNLAFALLVFSAALWAADDPLMGTWKLNLDKSKYSPGSPPMSSTNTYEPYGKDGFKFTSDHVDAQGKSSHVTFVAEYDGKDYPITGDPSRDAIIAKRIDLYTHQTTSKKGGKIMTTSRRVISKDGKTLTITTTGKNAQGQPVHNVMVYEKR
jgi:hypothetical protein